MTFSPVRIFTIAGIQVRAYQHADGLRTVEFDDVKKLFPVTGADQVALDLPEMVEMLTWMNETRPMPLKLDFPILEHIREVLNGPAVHKRGGLN